jgi:hypothetical protein
MTQTEIWQLDETKHEWGIPNETITDKMIRSAEKQGFIRGMTIAINHGWNKPSVVPNKDTYLLTICFDSTPSGYGYNGIFYSGDEDELCGVVAWRYDNAQDIYELLKQNGTI